MLRGAVFPDEKGRVLERPAIRKCFAHEIELIRSAAGWQWLVTMTALLLLVPWMLFVGEITFPSQRSNQRLADLYMLYLLCSLALHVLLASDRLKSMLPYARASLLGGLLFAAGLVCVRVGCYCPESMLLQVPGIIACSVGNTLLVSCWYQHYSRIVPAVAFPLVCLSVIASAVLYAMLLAIFPEARAYAAALLYLVVPIVAAKRLPRYVAEKQQAIALVGDRAVFSKQKLPCIEALIAIAAISFGAFVCASLEIGKDGLGLSVGTYIALAALIITALAALWASRALLGLNGLAATLNFMGTLLVLGLFAYSNVLFERLGVVLVLLGFVIMNVFHIVFYSSLCHMKRTAPGDFGAVLGQTRAAIPAALLIGAVAYRCFEVLPPWATSAGCFALGSVMFVLLMIVLAREIDDTRTELLGKSASSVSLDDIRAFAESHKAEYHLTPRECEIIHLVMCGRSVEAIAKELVISKSTVKTHVSSIYRKLGVNRRQAMIDLISHGLDA